MTWLSLFRPKHTLSSVAFRLAEELHAGTISLDTGGPRLLKDLADTLERYSSDFTTLRVDVDRLTLLSAGMMYYFAAVIEDLEESVQMARDIRFTSEPYLATEMAIRLRRAHAFIPILDLGISDTGLNELRNLAPMLFVAADQRLSPLEELSLKFQLKASETLVGVYGRAKAALNTQIYGIFQEVVEVESSSQNDQNILLDNIRDSLRSLFNKRIEDLEATEATLKMALEQSHLTVRTQSNTSPGIQAPRYFSRRSTFWPFRRL